MRFEELRRNIKQNTFTIADIVKSFPDSNNSAIRTQLFRFSKRNLITPIKRGFYCFDPQLVDEFGLANALYRPSYISLETALNYYGMTPDISQEVTSVTPTTTKNFNNQFGRFGFYRIKSLLFWGYTKIKLAKSDGFFKIAQREKALLDLIYVRKIAKLAELRLDTKNLNLKIYRKYLKKFPAWVKKVAIF